MRLRDGFGSRAKVLMNGLLRAKRVLIEAVRVSTETTRVSIGP
jgi:hypothetical protein